MVRKFCWRLSICTTWTWSTETWSRRTYSSTTEDTSRSLTLASARRSRGELGPCVALPTIWRPKSSSVKYHNLIVFCLDSRRGGCYWHLGVRQRSRLVVIRGAHVWNGRWTSALLRQRTHQDVRENCGRPSKCQIFTQTILYFSAIFKSNLKTLVLMRSFN